MKKHIQIIVTGLVQGVFYRKYTLLKAAELNLTGYVKNRNDGSVLIEAVGDDDVLSIFVDWCYTGSPQSKVENVTVTELNKPEFFSDFEMR